MGFKSIFKRVLNTSLNIISSVIIECNKPCEDVVLPLLHDGRSVKEVIKKRVMRRYNEKCKEVNIDPRLYKSYNFEKVFNLPSWLSFDEWLFTQLRGRDVDDLFVLNLDHIIPISIADNFEELAILFSWQNTRLTDPAMNELKSSHLDNENTLLCLRLLGRAPPAHWDGTIGQVVPPKATPPVLDKRGSPDNSDRFEKLIKNKGRKSENSSYRKKRR